MFESTRLFYRKLDETDYNLFFMLYSDKEVMKFAYLDRFESHADAIEAFKNILHDQEDKSKGTQFVVISKETKNAIGIVDYYVIMNHDFGGIFEIGYFMLPQYWGQGFGTEMGSAIIDYLFKNYNFHKVTASCNSNNRSSENIMIKLGMTKEGLFRKVRYKRGTWDDEIRYGLLKDEWNSEYEALLCST